MTNDGFERYQLQHLLSAPVDDQGNVIWPEGSGIPANGSPPLLTIYSDQDSQNMAAAFFLKNKVGLNFEHIGDPHHREWNDVTDALGRSGLRATTVIAQVLVEFPRDSRRGRRSLQETFMLVVLV